MECGLLQFLVPVGFTLAGWVLSIVALVKAKSAQNMICVMKEQECVIAKHIAEARAQVEMIKREDLTREKEWAESMSRLLKMEENLNECMARLEDLGPYIRSVEGVFQAIRSVLNENDRRKQIEDDEFYLSKD